MKTPNFHQWEIQLFNG